MHHVTLVNRLRWIHPVVDLSSSLKLRGLLLVGLWFLLFGMLFVGIASPLPRNETYGTEILKEQRVSSIFTGSPKTKRCDRAAEKNQDFCVSLFFTLSRMDSENRGLLIPRQVQKNTRVVFSSKANTSSFTLSFAFSSSDFGSDARK